MGFFTRCVLSFLLFCSFCVAEPLSQNKKKICFIVNPIAGTGKHKGIEKLIQNNLNHSLFTYDIVYTQRPHHATELSQQALSQKYDIIVAVGGDGSVNEVAQAIIGSSTVLGIIPTGSGNGLASHFQIPSNPKKAIAILNKCQTRWIDTVKINDRTFLDIAGIGFDATVSKTFADFGKRGLASYIRVIINELPKYKPKKYELIIDGKVHKRKAFLICFANGKQYGNNVYIAPQAKIDDGYLDIIILKEFPKHAAPLLIHELFNKRIDHSHYIETIRCQEVIIKQPTPHIHLDGEPMDFQEDIYIRILPSSLRILVPSLSTD